MQYVSLGEKLISEAVIYRLVVLCLREILALKSITFKEHFLLSTKCHLFLKGFYIISAAQSEM